MRDIIVYGIGVIILVIISAISFYALSKRSENVREKIDEFLDGLATELVSIIFSTIKEVNVEGIDTLEEFEAIVIKNIYDNCWNYIKDKINYELDGTTIDLIMENIDKDMVIQFIDKVLEKYGVTERIQGQYASYKIEKSETEKIDKQLAEEYSDNEKYFTDEVTESDLEPAKEEEYTEEEKALLNPPKEEEDVDDYDAEDDSMELVLDEEKDANKVVAVKDKNGNWRYYEVDSRGKKKQVSKEYALSILAKQEAEAAAE